MGLSVNERYKVAKKILDYVQRHPGCRIQDIIEGTECTFTEIADVFEVYIQDTNSSQEYDNRIETYLDGYLDGFDEFCDKVRERYGDEVIENISSETVVSLYVGFVIALPDIKKAEQSA